MQIERTTKAEGELIAADLTERLDLDGTYWLNERPEHPGHFFVTPAQGNRGEFRMMVGLDRQRGRITLLVNTTEAVVIRGATIEAF